MNKAERIERYGEEAYERKSEQSRAWKKAHPDQVQAANNELNRKGGRRYEKTLVDQRTGLRGERHKIRGKHRRQYKPFKDIIAPESQIHHEWIEKTAEYRGVALVEAKPHQYGIIDVIQILDGKITLLTEEAIRNGLKEKEVKNKMKEEDKKKGRYLQLHYYVSDADEALILQAGLEVGRFLDICVEDAVKRGKQNLGVEE